MLGFIVAFAKFVLFWWLVYLFVKFIIKICFPTPISKGQLGEMYIATGLKELDPQYYSVFHNVTLQTEDGTTQIDHIIVSTFGVFVIETKNMSGWIFGDPYQKQWTQKLFKESYKFQNPLHQNYKHTKTLEVLLCLKPEQIHSIIAFVGDSELKTELPKNVCQGVEAVMQFIRSKNIKVLTNLRSELIAKRLQTRRLVPSSETEALHIENLKKRFEINSQPPLTVSNESDTASVAPSGSNDDLEVFEISSSQIDQDRIPIGLR